MPTNDLCALHSKSLCSNQQAATATLGQKNNLNKGVSLDKKEIATLAKIGPKDDIAVLKPFCDKIALVGLVDISNLRVGALKQSENPAASLNTLWLGARSKFTKAAGEQESDPHPFNYVKLEKFYGASTSLGPGKASVVFGVSKQKKDDGFLVRMEFNPSRLGPEGLDELERRFDEAFDSAVDLYRWLARASMPSLDIACDFVNLDIRDVVLRSELGAKWNGWFGEFGCVQTWSHLAQKGKPGKSPPPVLKIYDKRRELISAGKEPRWGLVPHTRLERPIRQPKFKFLQIAGIGNPFAKVNVGYVPEIARAQGKTWKLFYSASPWMGVDRALSEVPLAKRARWRAALATAKASFWSSGVLWQGWSYTLERDGLMSWLQKAKQAVTNQPSLQAA